MSLAYACDHTPLSNCRFVDRKVYSCRSGQVRCYSKATSSRSPWQLGLGNWQGRSRPNVLPGHPRLLTFHLIISLRPLSHFVTPTNSSHPTPINESNTTSSTQYQQPQQTTRHHAVHRKVSPPPFQAHQQTNKPTRPSPHIDPPPTTTFHSDPPPTVANS